MPTLSDSVGDGGNNAVHDVAMVQMMLRAVKQANNAPYFAGDYTGTYGDDVKTAIAAFQNDQKLLPAAGPAGAPPANAEVKGLLRKDGATLAKLSAMLPAKYAAATIIAGTKTVYLAMDAGAAKGSAATITGKVDLDVGFRAKVAQLVNAVYAQQQIVLTIPPSGWRRDYAAQAAISPAHTGAGPGESNHNYGQAVDIGFAGLTWIKGNGDLVKEDFWLAKGHMPGAKQKEFWAARNAIATTIPIYPTHFGGDLIHLQAYNDAHVSYARSLAALLNAVTPNHIKWQAAHGKPHVYKSDLGLGGALFPVGTAREIWAGNSPLKKVDVATALNAKLAVDKTFDVIKFLDPTNPKQVAPAAPLKEADIKDAWVARFKTSLKANFQAADASWKSWKALP
jgi:peptidoglycan hydrolase-like protein with peptidoglycan-binding domain